MVTRFKNLRRRIPARLISGFVFVQLALSALTAPALPGGLFAYLMQTVPFLTLTPIGFIFALLAFLVFFTTDLRIHLLISVITLLIALISAYGALFAGVVSYQAGIVWLGLALHTLWAYPPESEDEHE